MRAAKRLMRAATRLGHAPHVVQVRSHAAQIAREDSELQDRPRAPGVVPDPRATTLPRARTPATRRSAPARLRCRARAGAGRRAGRRPVIGTDRERAGHAPDRADDRDRDQADRRVDADRAAHDARPQQVALRRAGSRAPRRSPRTRSAGCVASAIRHAATQRRAAGRRSGKPSSAAREHAENIGSGRPISAKAAIRRQADQHRDQQSRRARTRRACRAPGR